MAVATEGGNLCVWETATRVSDYIQCSLPLQVHQVVWRQKWHDVPCSISLSLSRSFMMMELLYFSMTCRQHTTATEQHTYTPHTPYNLAACRSTTWLSPSAHSNGHSVWSPSSAHRSHMHTKRMNAAAREHRTHATKYPYAACVHTGSESARVQRTCTHTQRNIASHIEQPPHILTHAYRTRIHHPCIYRIRIRALAPRACVLFLFVAFIQFLAIPTPNVGLSAFQFVSSSVNRCSSKRISPYYCSHLVSETTERSKFLFVDYKQKRNCQIQ